jgi:hypothetical protein
LKIAKLQQNSPKLQILVLDLHLKRTSGFQEHSQVNPEVIAQSRRKPQLNKPLCRPHGDSFIQAKPVYHPHGIEARLSRPVYHLYWLSVFIKVQIKVEWDSTREKVKQMKYCTCEFA